MFVSLFVSFLLFSRRLCFSASLEIHRCCLRVSRVSWRWMTLTLVTLSGAVESRTRRLQHDRHHLVRCFILHPEKKQQHFSPGASSASSPAAALPGLLCSDTSQIQSPAAQKAGPVHVHKGAFWKPWRNKSTVYSTVDTFSPSLYTPHFTYIHS